MTQFILGFLVVPAGMALAAAGDPVVSNVRSSQRAGTKLVDITYDVSDADSSTLTISAAVSTNAGVTFDLPATHFSGSGYGANVAPGTGKQIVWDAGADWDGQYSSLMRIKVTANDGIEPVIPPDPVTVASVSSNGVVTLMGAASAFLYTGANPIQTGVANGTIQLARSAVLRGRVMTRDGADLSGVTVSVNLHPEYGQTISRTNGMYDMAVNGGGALQLNYRKTGYLTAQRPLQVPWQDYVNVDDVALITADTNVTVIFLSSTNTAMQSAVGSWSSDADGIRRAAVLFPTGLQASIYTYAGATQSVDTLTVRLTEYTVGTNGQNAMPGELGDTVAYTYAVGLGADEAQAKISGKDVLFSTSVFFYVDNFIGMPIGTIVPAGYYDRDRACWVPAPNGLVVQCLGTNASGQVEMDTDGDGTADGPAALAALGITDQERSLIAVTFSPTQSLWRTPMTHFSSWDCNYGFGYDNAVGPSMGKDFITSQVKPDQQAQTPNTMGTIDLDSQVFREAIPIAGTPYSLHYSSERMVGYYSTLNIPVIGSTVPSGLLKIRLEIIVAGRKFSRFFDPLPNQSYDFEWDGLDVYGRSVYGDQYVTINIAYQYQAYYYYPPYMAASFGYSSGTKILSNIRVRDWAVQGEGFVRRWLDETFATTIRYVSPVVSQGLGGWTLNVQHNYDPVSRRIDLGTGDRQSAAVLLRDDMVMETAAGTGASGYSGDGGPATNAAFNGLGAIRVAPDGSYYIADGINYRVRRVDTNGIITTVAGNGNSEYSGDGGPATDAGLGYVNGLALAPDGSLYIACWAGYRVRRVGTNGIITTVAGNGTNIWYGDGGAATNASLSSPGSVAVSDDGSWYVTEPYRIRRIGADGIIHTVVGNGTQGSSGDGGPATNATIGMIDGGIALGPDGSLYLADGTMERIRRVDSSGIIHAFAGGLGGGWSGDGGPATNAQVKVPADMAIDANGVVYIAEYWNHVIRCVDVDGVILTIAGVPSLNGSSGGYGGPALAAAMINPSGIGIAPDGIIYVSDQGNGYIRRVLPKLPGVDYSSILTPSLDGQWIYDFDESGRHLRTWNALTCAKALEFTYSNGFLTAVTDGDGLITTIERNAAGTPTAIRGPYGQRTLLTMNAGGFLASVENPAAQKTELCSVAGMLTNVVGARGAAYAYGISYQAGRVSRGIDPAGGGQSLGTTTLTNGYQVSVTTAMGCVQSIRVEDYPAGGRRRVETAPDGTTFEKRSTLSKCETIQFADGSSSVLQWGPDPRFDMQAPLEVSNVVRSPGGLTLTASVARVVTWDGGSPFSMSSMTTREIINGRINTKVYLVSNRETTATTPAGRQTVIVVDSQERPTSMRVVGLETVSITYDDGRPVSLTTGDRVSTWTYDAAGFVAQTVDALGRTNQFLYDAVGRMTNQTLPGDRTISCAYDEHGNRTSLTPPGRTAHTFTYNLVDLESVYTPPAVAGIADPATRYTYNLDRQMVLVTRPDGKTIGNRYDSAGRKVARIIAEGQYTNAWLTNGLLGSVTSPDGVTLAYKYDGFLVTTMEWSGVVTDRVSFAHDNDFRVTSQALNGSAIAFGYDADSLLTNAGACAYRRKAENSLLTGSALGVVTDAYNYNGFGEVTAYTATSNGTAVFSRQYACDKLGRITNVVEINNGVFLTNDYRYDLAGRLTHVVTNGTGTNLYYYDSNGNRTNWQVGASFFAAQYDDQDRLVIWTGGTNYFNAAGDLTNRVVNGLTNAYSYDALGNLLGATLPGGTNITYRVDGSGRRVAKLVDGVFTQGWLYTDGILPVAELDAQSNVVSRFVYGNRINVPDYMVRGGTTYRIVTDHLGSPRLVMNTANGTIIQEMEYDEWGRVLRDTNPRFQPFGFAGGLYDPDTGLVRFGARDYDPNTGRWTAKDPMGFVVGAFNLYVYCNDDPVNRMDSMGLGPNWRQLGTGILQFGGGAVSLAIGIPTSEIGVGIPFCITGAYSIGAGGRNIYEAIFNPSGGVYVPGNVAEGTFAGSAALANQTQANVQIAGKYGSIVDAGAGFLSPGNISGKLTIFSNIAGGLNSADTIWSNSSEAYTVYSAASQRKKKK